MSEVDLSNITIEDIQRASKETIGKEIDLSKNLNDQDIGSIEFVEFIMELEENLNIQISDSILDSVVFENGPLKDIFVSQHRDYKLNQVFKND